MKEIAKTSDYRMVKYKDPETGKIKFRRRRIDDKIVDQEQTEDLRKWFGKGKKGDWVRVGTDGEIKGQCAREPGEGKPKCMPRSKAHSMSKKDRGSAARRKRAADPSTDRPGTGNKPIMVSTDKKKKNESIEEKNVPTNPGLWSKMKARAKAKFDVYPSAYANGWAAKQYKAAGGGWKTKKEDVNELAPATLKRYRDKAKDNKDTHKRIAHDYATRTGDSKSDWTDKMAKVHQRAADNRAKGVARANKKLGEEKTYFDFIAELTAKQRAEIEKRKASRMKTRGARRGPAKGTKTNDAKQQAKAKEKPLGFEVKKNDHHSTVHKTIAKAADAMHPSLGSDARHVSLKIGSKTKVYKNHKDLQHVVDYHSKLRDKSQKADLMRSVRSGGHDAISKHNSNYRKITKLFTER